MGLCDDNAECARSPDDESHCGMRSKELVHAFYWSSGPGTASEGAAGTAVAGAEFEREISGVREERR